MHSRLQDDVRNSLANALEGGYRDFLKSNTSERIVLDLLETQDYLYGPADRVEMLEYVREWKKDKGL